MEKTRYRISVKSCCCCSIAKSCQTLCDLMDCSTSGFPVLHYLLEFVQIHVHLVGNPLRDFFILKIEKARILSILSESISKPVLVVCVFKSQVSPFATPWTVACQAPLSMGFSRQEYWSGLPCFPPRDLPDLGIEPRFKWHPTPVFLPGEFHGQRSLAGYSPWGRKGLNMTE